MIGLATHRITAVQPSTSAGDYGHSAYDYNNPAVSATFSGRAVLIDAAEWQRLGFSGEAVYDIMLVVPAEEMPDGLASAGAAATWRITTIITEDGAPFMSGAIDIEEVTPIVGALGRVSEWRIMGKVVK